jgi:predicted metal-dependent HD superfamily phosphohydrolase
MIGMPLDSSHLATIEAHVRQLYAALPAHYAYHTLDHTLTVVKATRLIAAHEDLSDHEKCIVEAAAWFHDVGYARTSAGHEELSAFRSLLVLTRMGVNFTDIERIEACIMVTMLGSEPTDRMQAVLCDADMFHLASDDFWEWSTRLRKEWEAARQQFMTDAEWVANNISFMRSVKMRTDYGRKVMQPCIDANISSLEQMS